MFKQLITTAGTTIDKTLATTKPDPMLPRGSALITTSGNLVHKGINAIINAATGSMTRSGGIFDPTSESVTNSIKNSFTLLSQNSYKKIAVPFIGGNIFRNRIGVTKAELAKTIIDACLESNPDASQFVLVIYGHEDASIFGSVLHEYYPKVNSNIIKDGSVTDYNLHHCDTIMNASNMEVQFGGGLAGIIGRATGESHKIDAEALAAIDQFWSDQA